MATRSEAGTPERSEASCTPLSMRKVAVNQMSHDVHNLAPLPSLGTQASLSRTITEDDIRLFAMVSGDHNPIHLDAEYAARSLFVKRIAHGFLLGSLISAVLRTDLPGPRSIYLGQTLRFLAPI